MFLRRLDDLQTSRRTRRRTGKPVENPIYTEDDAQNCAGRVFTKCPEEMYQIVADASSRGCGASAARVRRTRTT